MAERNWTMRPMTADDFPRVRTLYAAVRDVGRPEAHDRWRLLDNPVAFPPAILAMDGDVCAGLYMLWPVRLQLGAEVVLGAQSVDTMIHPGYRNQGMFTALAEACFQLAAERGFHALYGFPNPLSYPGFVRKLDWDHTGDVPQWVRLIRPSELGCMPAALGPLADAAARLLPDAVPRGVDMVVGRPAPELLAGFLDEWRGRKGLCGVARDADWLNWRYSPDSRMEYEWLAAYRGGKPVACATWGLRGPAWGILADGRAKLMETFGADPAGLKAVIAATIGRARAKGAWMIETMTNVTPVTGLLPRLGFISHRKAPFIVRRLAVRSMGANLHTHANWRIVGGDVDTF